MPAPRLAATAALFALAGCMGPAEFRGWPEPPHKFADCTGAPGGLAACFERARAMCPEGYQLAELRSDPPINRYQIVVHCGPAPAPAAPPAAAPRATPPK